MDKPQIVILAGNGTSTHVLYNYISQYFSIQKVIIENKESTSLFLKRRIKRYGIVTVFGQLLFQIFCAKPIQLLSGSRRKEILQQSNLQESPVPTNKTMHVNSVNEEQCIIELQKINPKIILVNGTRIISKKVLTSANAIFINMHAGITPKYRGVHGGYWALANADVENCGVTIHRVDAGIDTGSILAQATITITKADNFTTYPLLQQAKGLTLLPQIISNCISNPTANTITNTLPSMLWVHPTIWQYLYFRIKQGVK